jgi:hypothetical protein
MTASIFGNAKRDTGIEVLKRAYEEAPMNWNEFTR